MPSSYQVMMIHSLTTSSSSSSSSSFPLNNPTGNSELARRIDERRVLARQLSQGVTGAVSERWQQSTRESANKAQGEVQRLLRAVTARGKEIVQELEDDAEEMEASAQQVLYGSFGLKPRPRTWETAGTPQPTSGGYGLASSS